MTVGEDLVRMKEIGNSFVNNPFENLRYEGKERDRTVVGRSGWIARLGNRCDVRGFPGVWDRRVG